MKIYYYLYQITNNLNNKIYVGVHKTKSLDDGYMGSGKIIRCAIEKHGISNFSKVILEHFDTSEAMYAREKEIVTEEFLLREDTYNLRRGGHGGFEYINKNKLNPYTTTLKNKKIHELTTISRVNRIKTAGLTNREQENLKTLKGWCIDNDIRKRGLNNSLTEKSRMKRINTLKKIKHQQGKNNSQFNTCWVCHKLLGAKKIKKELLSSFIDQGWVRGRKI